MARLTILSVLAPGIIAALFTVAAIVVPRSFNSCGKRDWAERLTCYGFGAIAIGVGFAISFRLQEGLPDIPPVQRWHWLVLIASGAAVVGVLHGLWANRLPGRLVTGLMLAAVTGLMLQPLPAFDPSWVWKAAVAMAVFMLWFSNITLAERNPGQLMPLVMMLAFTAASIVLIAGVSSAKFGVLAGSLACMSGFIMAIGLLTRKHASIGGSLTVLSTLLPAWMVTGHFYDAAGDVPLASFILIAVAPMALWIGEIPVLSRGKQWRRYLLGLSAVALLLAIAIALMVVNLPPPLEPYDY